MNRIFGEFKKAEIVEITAMMSGSQRDYHAYVWEKDDNKISLFVPDLKIAAFGIACEEFNNDDVLADAIKYFLLWCVDDLDEIINIKFPRRHSYLVG